MVLSLKKALRLGASFVLTVGCAAVPFAAQADSSVETYVSESIGQPIDNTLPRGIQWNKPLRAGQLALSRDDEGQPLVPPSLSRNGGAASARSNANAASQGESSANLMLMQGMRSALREGPPSNAPVASVPVEQASPSTALAAPVGHPSPSSAGPVYEPGREPRSLGALPPGAAETTAQTEAAPHAASLESFRGDGKTKAQEASATSAESSLAPVISPKNEVTSDVSSDAPETASGQTTSHAAGESGGSVFGLSVEEEKDPAPSVSHAAEKAATSSAMASAPVPSVPACQPQKTPWTRSCVDVGYPASYTGTVTGETRTECPSGEARDIWLNNTCGPAGSPAAENKAVPETKKLAAVEQKKNFLKPYPQA